ncbi:MAG: universal stress protein [Actinomycetota bacterium]
MSRARARGHILLPLDGSEVSRLALGPAGTMSSITGWPLRLLHVGPADLTLREAKVRLGLTHLPLPKLKLVLATGDATSEILAAAEASEVRMVVMASHGATADLMRRAGSVTDVVLRRILTPLLVVRPGTLDLGGGIRRILVPLDGSPGAAGALRPAVQLAHKTAATLTVLHVLTPERPRTHGTFTAPGYADQAQYEWGDWRKEFLARFCQSCPTMEVEMSVRSGDPAARILESADLLPADLVVISWSHRLAGKRARAVKALLERAPCPVLFLPCLPPPTVSSGPAPDRGECDQIDLLGEGRTRWSQRRTRRRAAAGA